MKVSWFKTSCDSTSADLYGTSVKTQRFDLANDTPLAALDAQHKNYVTIFGKVHLYLDNE
jgi:hypothetical protein